KLSWFREILEWQNDASNAEEFEQALCDHLRSKGWRVKKTPRTGDFGADLVCVDPNGRSCVIQAKRWKGNVGVSAVQQAHAAKDYYSVEYAIVATNSNLTESAQDMANKLGVITWERKRIHNMLKYRLTRVAKKRRP
ncbi:MAG: restriction endonuclease, partial [Alicyclobacillus sp.]|nr:restriction endonuclease [Alicyclobacillus sp.]